MQKIQLNYVLSDDQLICLNPSPPPPFLRNERKSVCILHLPKLPYDMYGTEEASLGDILQPADLTDPSG